MSGKVQLDPLFQGGLAVGALRALKMFHQEKGTFEQYLIPFAGNFAVAEALVDAGVEPAKIRCGDTTLYASVLGHLADPARSIATLGFHTLSPELDEILSGFLPAQDPELSEAARILWAIKWAQLHSEKDFIRWRRKEMEAQAVGVFGAYVNALNRMRERLAGLTYESANPNDMCEQAEEHSAEHSTLIFYAPPASVSGYTKMFDPHGAFGWNEPVVPVLHQKGVGPFIAKLAGYNSTVLTFASEGPALADSPEGAWEPLYTEIHSKSYKRSYILSNVPSKVSVLNRRKFRTVPDELPPVYDDHEITAESEISYVKSNMDTVLYFYDLFARELGMVKAEVYYLFCIDGQVAGAMGFDVRTYMTTRLPRMYETFGLSITSNRHARIGRLLMAGMCCRQFVQQFQNESTVADGLLLPDLNEIQTTCLTKYHEAKKNRGILKLVSREALPNGRFHLVYRTPVHDDDFTGVLAKWLKKHASYTRGGKK